MKLAAEQDPKTVIELMLGQSLDGPLGNAWMVVGATRGYLQDCGLEKTYIDSLLKDAFSDDYSHLLTICAEALLET